MKSNKINKQILGAIICVIIFIIISIILLMKNIGNNSNNSNTNIMFNGTSETTVQNEQQSEDDEELIEELKSVSESERIKIYLGKYFKNIEKKEYNKAYDLLYPEFKENYFPTLEDYEKYIDEQEYADLLTIDYDDIYMQGEYYIVTVRIGNLLAGTDIVKKEKTFIIKENGYNDYYISLKK